MVTTFGHDRDGGVNALVWNVVQDWAVLVAENDFQILDQFCKLSVNRLLCDSAPLHRLFFGHSMTPYWKSQDVQNRYSNTLLEMFTL